MIEYVRTYTKQVRNSLYPGFHIIGGTICAWAATRTSGIWLLLSVGAAAILTISVIGHAIKLLRADSRPRTPSAELILFIGTLTFLAVLTESGLYIADELTPDTEQATIPPRLKFRAVGNGPDFYLMGHLHEHNRDGFRTQEFASKAAGTFRIVALGDSLTFGQGISRQNRYSNLIEQELGRIYRVEVINLGKMAYQSEHILETAQEWLPRLDPDVVLYGHCLNDFLPRHRGQYTSNRRWEVPIPEPLASSLIERTRVGAFIDDRYNRLLLKLGIRRDFFDDILGNFNGYVDRFTEDMVALNMLAQDLTGRPVVTLVLNQYPADSRGRDIGLIAEQSMRTAGMTVIPAEYILKYMSQDIQLHVNQWEGHPNEFANRIFADSFLSYFRTKRSKKMLTPYRRDSSR